MRSGSSKQMFRPTIRSRRLGRVKGVRSTPRRSEYQDRYFSQRAVRTASNWQVRQPIYKSARRRWKNYEKDLLQLKSDLRYGEGA